MDRKNKEAWIITNALRKRKKRCRCFWIFVSRAHDRYKISCTKVCPDRDRVLAMLNAA